MPSNRAPQQNFVDLATVVLVAATVPAAPWLRKLKLDPDRYFLVELLKESETAQIVGATLFGGCIVIGKQAHLAMLQDGLNTEDLFILPERVPRSKSEVAELEHLCYAYLNKRGLI